MKVLPPSGKGVSTFTFLEKNVEVVRAKRPQRVVYSLSVTSSEGTRPSFPLLQSGVGS